MSALSRPNDAGLLMVMVSNARSRGLSIEALEIALLLLRGEGSVTSIAAETRMPRTSVARYVGTLIDAQFVAKAQRERGRSATLMLTELGRGALAIRGRSRGAAD